MYYVNFLLFRPFLSRLLVRCFCLPCQTKYELLCVCRFAVVRIPAVEGKARGSKAVLVKMTTSNAAIIVPVALRKLPAKTRLRKVNRSQILVLLPGIGELWRSPRLK